MTVSSGKKVAVITGCSSGVGLATAVELAKAGYTVVATMRNLAKREALDAAAQAAGVALELWGLDVRVLDVESDESVKTCFDGIHKDFGRVDLLINNAGHGYVRPLEQTPVADWHLLMNTHVYGAVRCIQAVLPGMRARKSGHLVTVTSVGGLVGFPLNEAYCAAKFALEGAMESLATYLPLYFGIHVSVVEPAGIKTEFVNRVMSDLAKDQAQDMGVYNPVLGDYMKTVRGRSGVSGEVTSTAQTPQQVAQSIAQLVALPQPPLRWQTSDFVREFTSIKLGTDPTGAQQLAKQRGMSLGR